MMLYKTCLILHVYVIANHPGGISRLTEEYRKIVDLSTVRESLGRIRTKFETVKRSALTFADVRYSRVRLEEFSIRDGGKFLRLGVLWWLIFLETALGDEHHKRRTGLGH
jgi:hypothetical protein